MSQAHARHVKQLLTIADGQLEAVIENRDLDMLAMLMRWSINLRSQIAEADSAGGIATEAPIPFGRTGKSHVLVSYVSYGDEWLSQANKTTYGSADLSETMRLTKTFYDTMS